MIFFFSFRKIGKMSKKKKYKCSICLEVGHNKRTCDFEDEKIEDAIKLSLTNNYINKNCSICLDEHSNYKTDCNHFFCFDCLITWINEFKDKTSTPSCPNCKKKFDIFELLRLDIYSNKFLNSELKISKKLLNVLFFKQHLKISIDELINIIKQK